MKPWILILLCAFILVAPVIAQERVIQKATSSDVTAGLNDSRYVTPLKLHEYGLSVGAVAPGDVTNAIEGGNYTVSGPITISNGTFIGNGSGLTNLPVFTNSQVLWVDGNGSDSTGRRGVFERPFRTIAGAVSNALAGDTINLISGQSYTNTKAVTFSNLTLIATGARIIIATNEDAADHNIKIAGDFTMKGGSVRQLGPFGYPFFLECEDAQTVVLDGIELYGWTDGFYCGDGVHHVKARNCSFESYWDIWTDNATSSGHTYEFTACSFKIDPIGISTPGVGPAGNALRFENSKITVVGCSVTISNVAEASGLQCDTGSTMSISGTRLDVVGSNSSYPINNLLADAGAVTVYGHPYDGSWFTGLPKINFIGDATNAPTSGAFLTVDAAGRRGWSTNVVADRLKSGANSTNQTVWGGEYKWRMDDAGLYFDFQDSTAIFSVSDVGLQLGNSTTLFEPTGDCTIPAARFLSGGFTGNKVVGTVTFHITNGVVMGFSP